MAEQKLTTRQENFVLNIFNGMSQYEAFLKAGYSGKSSRAVIDVNASKLSKKTKIVLSLAELRKEAKLPDVASFGERQRVLTEITRARMTDFMTCGADGTWMHDIGEETLNTAALKRVDTTTMPYGDKKDDLSVILTKVELINPIEAIKELNKMDGVYAPDPLVNNDNRTFNIVVMNEEQKGLVKRLIDGERTNRPESNKSI